MKTWTKVFTLLIAVMMVFSLAAPIFAAGEGETYTLTINGQYTGHTYEAYQVFSGVYSEDYVEDADGVYYKLNDGTYTKEAPTAETYENYVGGAEIEGEDSAESTYTATKYTQKRILSDIEWGTGVDGTALLEELISTADANLVNEDGTSLFKDCKTADEVADIIKSFENNSDAIDAFAMIVAEYLVEEAAKTSIGGTDADKNDDGTYKYTIEPLAAGYYFVKDTDKTITTTKYILEVVDSLTITAKADKPTLEKNFFSFRTAVEGEEATHYELKDGTFTEVAPTEETTDKYVNTEKTHVQVKVKTSDANVGQVIPYVLDSKVPVMDGYNTYTFIVHDTMSEGLTFNNDVEIKINGTTLTKIVAAHIDDEEDDDYNDHIAYDYCVESVVNEDGTTDITITFHNFINYKGTDNVGKPIVITYSATVNEKATVGNAGNDNTAYLEFSGNPYDDEVTGETPKSKTYVYETGIKLIKIDGETEEILTGAKFQISGTYKDIVVIDGFLFAEFTDADEAKNADDDETNDVTPYWRLKDGKYTETDPETVTDETKDDYDTDEDGNYPKYKKVTFTTTEEQEHEFVTDAWVDENGVITFTGLGAGEYTITELVAPVGYNSLKAPIVVTIGWEAPENIDVDHECTWTIEGANAPFNEEDGVFELKVENRTGTTLPSTGGIGTTIFYVLGAILAVGAVVVLVTKKRMGEDNAR